MKTKAIGLTAMMALAALVVFSPTAAADCDNYGNQVYVASDYNCTANYQYCHQGSGAGAGAGAGAGGPSNGNEAEAGASAGTSSSCSQNNGGDDTGTTREDSSGVDLPLQSRTV